MWEIGELNSLGVTEDVVRHCERMWVDRTLARMAVPDVLEVESIDRDGVVSSLSPFFHATTTFEPTRSLFLSHKQKVKRTFQDIQTTLTRGWPSRDHVTGAKEPTELNISRRVSLLSALTNFASSVELS